MRTYLHTNPLTEIHTAFCCVLFQEQFSANYRLIQKRRCPSPPRFQSLVCSTVLTFPKWYDLEQVTIWPQACIPCICLTRLSWGLIGATQRSFPRDWLSLLLKKTLCLPRDEQLINVLFHYSTPTMCLCHYMVTKRVFGSKTLWM
jgi:hypothetical protein